MKPFRRILVPVDFSAYSVEAIGYAADLSRRYEASVTLAHVYQAVAFTLPEGYVLHTATQLASMIEAFEDQLEAIKAKAEAEGALRVDTMLLHGVPASEIVSYAKENGHDLIVMGTHGRTGLGHALLGSVAENVVRKASCPVLTIRLAEQG